MTSTRKTRPLQLSIPVLGGNTSTKTAISANTVIVQSPIDAGINGSSSDHDPSALDGDDELQLSPLSVTSSPASSPLDNNNSAIYFDATDDDEDGSSREWYELRQKVKTNLRLRPIRSSHSLATQARAEEAPFLSSSTSSSPSHSLSSVASTSSEIQDEPLPSPTSTSRSSIYYTPAGETPISAGFGFLRTPQSAHFIGIDHGSRNSSRFDYASHHIPRSPSPRAPRAVEAYDLHVRLGLESKPLLIDTRPLPAYLESRLVGSINLAIPTLILKRSRKGGGFPSLDALRSYITTDGGREVWDARMDPEGDWDGDLVIYDEDMDERAREDAHNTAWALLPLVERLVGSRGAADWLRGGIASAFATPSLRQYFVAGEEGLPLASLPHLEPDAGTTLRVPSPRPGSQPNSGKKPGGLFQLDTAAAARSRPMPVLEDPSPASASASPSAGPMSTIAPLPHSPLPMMSNLMVRTHGDLLADASPSPAPSAIGFTRPPKPPSRRPSAPSLGRLDTRSAERLPRIDTRGTDNTQRLPKLDTRSNDSLPRLPKLDTRSNERLPKLTVRPVPSKSLTLGVPTPSPSVSHSTSNASLRPPRSPSHLTLAHSNHMSPPVSAVHAPGGWGSFGSSSEHLPPPTPSWGAGFPPSPRTPRSARSLPPSPGTARPSPDTASAITSGTEEAFPDFTVSTILPSFLFLGPELTTEEHVKELMDRGVRRILNLAFECDDDAGLRLRERFERYVRIPMRDTVEEDNITQGVRLACDMLDDARLHSAPTYVHCKAGKSRSVTAVMAYLIHANRWTLSQAYSFVLERRKGISPNIGFVSELMGFEQHELGTKSMGVVSNGPNGDGAPPDPPHPTYGRPEDGPLSAAPAAGGNPAPPPTNGMAGSYGTAAGTRRQAHLRESLPPLNRPETEGTLVGAHTPEQGLGEEVEIRDGSGRYRHFRRAPVDDKTLQPMRRVSKAGLESTGWE